MSEKFSDKIIRNTLYNAIGRFWGILINIFLAPFIIRHIGIEAFGIWAIVGAITGYFGLFDFGLVTSFVKHVSEFHARKDLGKINEMLNAGFVFYFLFGVAIVSIAFLFADPVMRLFKIPPYLHHQAVVVFLMALTLFSVSNILSPFNAIQISLQRMDISNKVSIATSIPYIAGVIFFLKSGYGLIGLMVNSAILLFITGLTSIIIAFRLMPGLKFNPFLLKKGALSQLISFGCKLQVSKIANVLLLQTNRLFIAYFFNISLVGFYQLGSSITEQVRQIPLLLVSALLPAASEIEAKRKQENLRELYMRGSKYVVFVGVPLVIFLVVSAQMIMRAWMGTGYERSVRVIQVLAPGYLFNLVTGVGVMISVGIGKPEIQMRSAVVAAVSNILLCFVFIFPFGFIGIAAATTIAFAIGSTSFLIMLHPYLGIPQRKFLKDVAVLPVVGALLPAALLYLVNISFFKTLPPGRLANLSIIAFECTLFTALYLAAIFKNRYFDGYDISLFRTHMGRHLPWRQKEI